MQKEFDPILLEVMWNRLISIVNEQAAALIRSSFTTIVREVEDLSCGIFTPDAQMVVQADTGTPGHINTMATGVKHFVARYPKDVIRRGDVLVTNDPWLCSGHRNDFTAVTPIFSGDVLIGWTATCCHSVDIGGAGFSADTHDVFEEGLGIPIVKLFEEGKPNEDVFEILKTNTRMPKPVIGDIMAQISSQDVCANKLAEFMDQYELDSIEPLAGQILDRSEKAMRTAISELPDGRYTHEVFLDGFEEPIKLVCTVSIDGSDLTVDYKGSSDQINRGINVPFNYTHAYTSYPLKALINPDIPNNDGSFAPVKVTAPEGCILNAQFPCPVMGRHLTGHFCVAAVVGAFEKITPERTVGDAGGVYIPQWFGRTEEGIFTNNYFCSGGMGARFNKDGIHAYTFPSNVKNSPVEVMEVVSPLFFQKKEIRNDSGGPGRFRGGCGQSISVKITNQYPGIISGLFERTKIPAPGRKGGGEGKLAEFIIRDKEGRERRPHPKSKHALAPGDYVVLNLPGGGGYGPAWEREPEAVLEDVIQGYVSARSAEEDFFVAIASKEGKLSVNLQKTKELRDIRKKKS
jgi:N-methylhydantoinase B